MEGTGPSAWFYEASWALLASRSARPLTPNIAIQLERFIRPCSAIKLNVISSHAVAGTKQVPHHTGDSERRVNHIEPIVQGIEEEKTDEL